MKKLGRKNVYISNWLDVYLDKVELPDGTVMDEFHVINYHRDGVAVIVENEKDEILFVKVYRYLLESVEWEIPAGGTEKGEKIMETGEREVLEETGYSIKKLEPMFSYHPASGSSNLKFHVLKAVLDTSKAKEKYDENEIAEVKWIGKEKVLSMIRNNEFQDGFTLTALLHYLFLK